MATARERRTILSPQITSSSYGLLQISAHECPSSLASDLVQRVLTCDASDGSNEEVFAIIIMQNSVNDLVSIGPTIETEKNTLLELFTEIAIDIVTYIKNRGHFADYIDPCSGMTMYRKEKSGVYDEVQGAQLLLGYSVHNAGCCKILLHPKWRSSVYPASIFTTAPREVVISAIVERFPDIISPLAEAEPAIN